MFTFLVIYGLFLLIFALIGIVFYVIFAFAFYKMALNAGLENPWLAWIPVAQWYILAKLIKSLKISEYEIPNLEFVLPGATLIVMAFNRIPVIGGLLSLANYILLLFSLNKLYKIYKPDLAVLYTVLSVFAFPVPFIFLSLKDLKPIE